MNNRFEELIKLIKEYNPSEVENVTKAYNYAKMMHEGQYRESGEEYITHPVEVAYILAEMHADGDTLCAGLLHDVLEDTASTKDEISHLFNPRVATLVDGVTKMSKLNFSSKKDEVSANTRKIITGITTDVRIIIVKLADRLHNMRTLKYLSRDRQIANAKETQDLYAPLANRLRNIFFEMGIRRFSF
jgi:GTP pyrophosphokinase